MNELDPVTSFPVGFSTFSTGHSGTEVVLVREGPRAGGAPHSGKRGPTISRRL